MHSTYQQPKSRDYGVNLCEGCFQKQREIDRLKEENQQLRAKLSQQKRKDKEGFFGSSTPSSKIPVKSNSTQEKKKNQGGAKIGHLGNGRKKHTEEEADEIRTVNVEPVCPECHSVLESKDYRERSVLDIDPIKIKKIIYRLERKECPCCGVRIRAKVPEVLPKNLLSNQLLTEIVDLHYLQGLPLGRVCARFELNYGTVIQSLHRLRKIFEPVMEKFKCEYRKEFIRHADETGWRTDGENGYCWYFGSDTVSLHLYRNTRSAKVVEEVLGKQELEGYLVVDRYKGYYRVRCKIQFCYAHLLRDMKDLQSEFLGEKEVQAYAQTMIELLGEAMNLQSIKQTDELYYTQAKRIKKEMFEASLSASHHLAIKRWQDFYVEEENRLYHWVEERLVPCQNNRAERELRPTVIARKVSFGSQAEEGAKTREVLMSVIQSLRKRVTNPREKFKEALDRVAINPQLEVTEILFNADDG